jgi:uncharacterized protein (TIGR02466 family)
MIEIKPLFPTAIYMTNINIMPSEMKRLMGLYEDKDNWKTNVNGNFTSKETYVLDNVLGGKRSMLVNEIQHHIDEFSKQVMGEKPSLRITQSWMNYNPPDKSHHKHFHGNSIVSGVLYIKTTPLSGAFIAHKREVYTNIMNTKINNTYFNSDEHRIVPTDNTLILFESSLPHSVESNNSKETRISLAFNTFYKNDMVIGDEFNLSGLKI